MNQHNQEVGKEGEDLAAMYLKEHGFEILKRNYRCGRNEIDIVARKLEVISFVEVKSRYSDAYGHPAESVTRAKQRELAKAGECYIRENPTNIYSYRFDVVAIQFSNPTPHIEFIEDAFRIF